MAARKAGDAAIGHGRRAHHRGPPGAPDAVCDAPGGQLTPCERGGWLTPWRTCSYMLGHGMGLSPLRAPCAGAAATWSGLSPCLGVSVGQGGLLTSKEGASDALPLLARCILASPVISSVIWAPACVCLFGSSSMLSHSKSCLVLLCKSLILTSRLFSHWYVFNYFCPFGHQQDQVHAFLPSMLSQAVQNKALWQGRLRTAATAHNAQLACCSC